MGGAFLQELDGVPAEQRIGASWGLAMPLLGAMLVALGGRWLRINLHGTGVVIDGYVKEADALNVAYCVILIGIGAVLLLMDIHRRFQRPVLVVSGKQMAAYRRGRLLAAQDIEMFGMGLAGLKGGAFLLFIMTFAALGTLQGKQPLEDLYFMLTFPVPLVLLIVLFIFDRMTKSFVQVTLADDKTFVFRVSDAALRQRLGDES